MASLRRSGSLESVGSQRRDHFVNFERRRDRYMAHTHSERMLFIHFEQIGQHKASHNTRNEEVYNLEKKMERLRRCLHRRTRMREDRTPSPNQDLSTGSDKSYRPQSRTPPSESFTSSSHCTSRRKHYHRKSRTPPRRGEGHDAMGKARL